MISVIICSYRPVLLEKIAQNIKDTIGVEYELLAFDNRQTQVGICKVYNNFMQIAKYPFVCFIHEDVRIDTNGWGQEIIKSGLLEGAGIIGVAGGMYVAKNFISWGDTPKYDRWNYWEYLEDSDTYKHKYYNPECEKVSKTVTLDGVFLFTRTEIARKYPFDEICFQDFHLYDADFTINISQQYQNYVHHGIKLIHFSSGNSLSKSYCDNLQVFHSKWNTLLPFYIRSKCTPNFVWKQKKELDNMLELLNRYKRVYGIFEACKIIKNSNSMFTLIALWGYKTIIYVKQRLSSKV